ncbi:MAG: DUF5681 domain-containing protein [Bradyrhizobium sp.]|jgi:hypothetical protein
MSSDGDDDKTGYRNPPARTRWKEGESGNRQRRYPKRVETTIELIDRLLLKPVEITVGEKSRKVTTLEAILFRLWQKEVLGDTRALKIRLKFQEFARQYSKPRIETVFVDNEYTAAFAAIPQIEDDTNG